MEIKPVEGMCFVIEDVHDGLTDAVREMGFVSTAEVNAGATGVVYEISNGSRECEKCGAYAVPPPPVKKGDHIIFSKFVAEHIILHDGDGKEIKNLKTVPVEAILGVIHD